MKKTLNRLFLTSLSLMLVFGIVLSACTAPGNKPVEDDAKTIPDEKPIEDQKDDSAASGGTQPEGALVAVLAPLHEKVKKHWPHMDKVWPGYDYKNHNLLIFDYDEMMEVREAWLLNVDTMRKLEANEYENIQLPQMGGYAELQFEGKPSISMGIDSQSKDLGLEDEVYKVATHELVHFYYQSQANVSFETNRASSYPIDPTPRLYRQMLFHRLIAAYDHPDQEAEYLAKAKYWLEKYKSEFAEEYNATRSTDIVESSARYSENLANLIGDDLDQKAFVEAMQPMIFRNAIFDSASAEGYEIGFIAGLILDRQGVEWKKDFYKNDQLIEEVLLAKVETQEDAADKDFETKLKAEIDKVNQEAQAALGSILKAKDDKSIPYLKLDISQSMASFGASGSLMFDGMEVMTGYTSSYQIGEQRLTINNLSVVQDMEGEHIYLIIPLTMEHKLEGDVLTIDTPELKLDGVKVQQSQEDGRSILTATVTE